MAPFFIIVSLWGDPVMRMKVPDGSCDVIKTEISVDIDRSFTDRATLARLRAETAKAGHPNAVRSDVRVWCTQSPPIIKHSIHLPLSEGRRP